MGFRFSHIPAVSQVGGPVRYGGSPSLTAAYQTASVNRRHAADLDFSKDREARRQQEWDKGFGLRETLQQHEISSERRDEISKELIKLNQAIKEGRFNDAKVHAHRLEQLGYVTHETQRAAAYQEGATDAAGLQAQIDKNDADGVVVDDAEVVSTEQLSPEGVQADINMERAAAAVEQQIPPAALGLRPPQMPTPDPERKDAGAPPQVIRSTEGGQLAAKPRGPELMQPFRPAIAEETQGLTVTDPEGRRVAEFSPPQQRRFRSHTQRQKFADRDIQSAWEATAKAVEARNMPFEQARLLHHKMFNDWVLAKWKRDAQMALASRPRGGGRPINDYKAGRDDAARSLEPLRRAGENFAFLDGKLRGLSERNPILSSAALIGLAKGAHQGDRLTDKDIQMMNINPSIWNKFKNLVSLQATEEIDGDTRRRMTEALMSIRRGLVREGAKLYRAAREEYDQASQYALPGYSAGLRAGIPQAAALLPGLYRPEHFGLGKQDSDKGASKKALDSVFQ